MGLGEWIVIGLSLLIGLTFAVGSFYNSRLRQRVDAWLRRNLKDSGEMSPSKWLDPSTAGLRQTINSKSLPFELVDWIVLLERRENLPLWLYQLATGRRDALLMQAMLKTTPTGEVHAFREDRDEAPKLVGKGEQIPTPTEKVDGYLIYVRGKAAPEDVARVHRLITQYKPEVLRISLKSTRPNLTVYMHLDRMMKRPSKELLRIIGDAVK